jgi:hypothetical protein
MSQALLTVFTMSQATVACAAVYTPNTQNCLCTLFVQNQASGSSAQRPGTMVLLLNGVGSPPVSSAVQRGRSGVLASRGASG